MTRPGKAPLHSSSEDDSETGTQSGRIFRFTPSVRANVQNVADRRDQPSKRGLFQCPHCPYIAHYASVLDIHLRRHSGEKPFRCSVCPAAFAQVGTYNRHLRTHTGEKPFTCDLCPFSTAHRKSLFQHRATHARSRPFT
ncbi:hypothetical protein MTO96_035779 [Rhipicephalus appendiculatus]